MQNLLFNTGRTQSGIVDKIWDYEATGHTFEFQPLFSSSARKYFTFFFKFNDFLRSLVRFIVLIRIITSEFYKI